MKRTNQRELVRVAREFGSAVASSWTGHRHSDGSVAVVHYGTHLVTVLADGTVIPENRGWGSTTDRCGIRKITGKGYRELFGC